jgi:hypothetical protein
MPGPTSYAHGLLKLCMFDAERPVCVCLTKSPCYPHLEMNCKNLGLPAVLDICAHINLLHHICVVFTVYTSQYLGFWTPRLYTVPDHGNDPSLSGLDAQAIT